jgi:hypothetical protein
LGFEVAAADGVVVGGVGDVAADDALGVALEDESAELAVSGGVVAALLAGASGSVCCLVAGVVGASSTVGDGWTSGD